jgi:hypothetical protein
LIPKKHSRSTTWRNSKVGFQTDWECFHFLNHTEKYRFFQLYFQTIIFFNIFKVRFNMKPNFYLIDWCIRKTINTKSIAQNKVFLLFLFFFLFVSSFHVAFTQESHINCVITDGTVQIMRSGYNFQIGMIEHTKMF